MFCQKLSQAAIPQFKAFPRLELDCNDYYMDAGTVETLKYSVGVDSRKVNTVPMQDKTDRKETGTLR